MISKKSFYNSVFFGISLSALIPIAQADSQRLQWDSNKHFYQRFDQGLTWQMAQAACKSKGAHLVTITSDSERDFINNNVYKERAYWIGGFDKNVNGTFEWVTGEKWGYQNFSSNFKNTSAVDYLWASPYEWGSDSATDINVYVCEWTYHNYLNIVSVPDINRNGVDEVAVLYIDYITKKHTVKVRDPKTDSILSTLTFKSGNLGPQGLVVIKDINGNGVPEVGLMYSQIAGVYSALGQPVVDFKDAKNDKVYLKSISFLNSGYSAKSISVSADSNRNGSNEIMVMGLEKTNNTPRVEIRDSKTGALLNDTKF